MLKLGRATKVKVLFLLVVFVFNFDLFKFLAAILEKGLLDLSCLPYVMFEHVALISMARTFLLESTVNVL